VLEYLAGGTLADRLLIGPISVAEVVSMGLAVSNALDTLHTAGMLHGDIKPSNIGYTATRFPKVLDFGLARLVTGISRMIPAIRSSVSTAGVPRQTSRSTILDVHETEVHLTGTAAYLSPEAISMERPAAAFDLWSLAVTLLEALTGRNPFHGSSMLDTIRRVGMSELGDPREMCADCPPALAQFLLSALSRHREERPSSARMFHDMLSKCM
jgi:serine/threonine protein kinase